MATLSERARRRSSLFFGNSFSLASLKSPISPASPSEQTSYPNLKHEVRQISAMKEHKHSAKSSLAEPLFQDSYLSSSEDDTTSADMEEPESPTFSECNFHDAEEGYDDDDEKEDALEDFGLGLAIETFKPNDVARKVSIVVCKPRVVDITPPTSPTFSRGSSSTSSIRPQSRPSSAYFGGWNAFHDRDSYSSAKSSSEQSHRSSSSSLSNVSKSIDAMSISPAAIVPPMPTDAPILQRTNALKRQSHRLSSSFSRSFLAKAGDELPSPTETLRPMTPRPTAPRTPHERLLSLQIPANFPSVDTMPPPPEMLPRPRTPALKKKKSIADVWFKRRSVSTYV